MTHQPPSSRHVFGRDPHLSVLPVTLTYMRSRQPCVYILASGRFGTLYTGVTSDLAGRVWQHRNDETDGFCHEYSVHDLVWFETHECMRSAIVREKRVKRWRRAWKIRLIEEMNPGWVDLYQSVL
ncbi:GIY-YIG nuclease family protein [Nocardia sp. NPDC056000]|uniref:GIY-YIG nuclease family protein n=1 Tax=Nocardia sp. NPDC056000 TaxID=3345674 RepID=UPI0035E197E9